MDESNRRVFVIAVRSSDHLVQQRQYRAAATILENYLRAHGTHAAVLQRLGQIRLRQGRAREAAVLLERALACHFENITARERRGDCVLAAEPLAVSA